MAGGKFFTSSFEKSPFKAAEDRVKPEWVDYNGHMNVGYYGLAFDQSIEGWYEDWIDLGPSYVERENMGPFAIQSNLHYIAEQKEGERFEVFLQLLDYDHKRWHIFMTMINAETGELAATNEQLSMNVDLQTRRSAPLATPQHERLGELWDAHRDLPRPPQVGAPIGIRRR